MISTHAIQEALADARHNVPRESRWQHKKGGLYRVVGHAFHSESESVVVLYSRFGGPNYDPAAEEGIMFARPAEMWTEDRFVPYTPS